MNKRLALEDNGKDEFGPNRQGKRKNPGGQGTRWRTDCRKTSKDEASSKEDDRCHDGHLCEFRPAFAHAWHEKRDSKDTQHDGEVRQPGATVLLKGRSAKRVSSDTSPPRSAGAAGSRMKEQDQRLYSLPIVSDLDCSNEQLFKLQLRLGNLSKRKSRSSLVPGQGEKR